MTDEARLRELIGEIDRLVPDARPGLPSPLFYLVSRLTPLVNVDLWAKNDRGEALLTYREDAYYEGWHVPGGIVRFKETAAERVAAVATAELGACVEADATPCEIHEMRSPERDLRGHFISLLFRVRLTSAPSDALACSDLRRPRHGQWAWHRSYPSEMIPQHAVYRHLFEP